MTNTGTTTISSIAVADNKLPAVSCPESSLVAGASQTCTGVYTTTQPDVDGGSVTNTATASGSDPYSNTLSSNSSTVTVAESGASSSLSLLKSTATSAFSKAGQTISYDFPTAGNDLVLIGALGTVGLMLGIASGLATHVRAGENGLAVARVGWLAGGLLIAGISSRMVFVFAIDNGARHAVASFSMAHQIGAAAWPVALVLMALLEVGTRIAIVQLRGRNAMRSSGAPIVAIA